jgi:hypothetical protein
MQSSKNIGKNTELRHKMNEANTTGITMRNVGNYLTSYYRMNFSKTLIFSLFRETQQIERLN